MSTEEILEALTSLSSSNLKLIAERADELRLKKAFDWADAEFEKEGGISLAEA